MKKLSLLLAVFTVLGCQPTKSLVRPEDWSAVKLSEFRANSETQRNGLMVVRAKLEKNGENLNDFYLGPVTEKKNGTIEFPLYHVTNFGERIIAPGGLEGNSRIMVYDPTRNTILQELHWQ